MTLSFSPNGPAFPEQLVDALLTGDVVFLCGAGVSAPQLPGFGDLVRQCFDRLHVEMNASEQISFDAFRYEEVLGSLSRRIVDPTEMLGAVVQSVQTPVNPDLANHRTILRISRDLENLPVIVTTNFDNLLEVALREREPVETVRALSVAGQGLPAPGSAGFGGIIHIHGRIADADLDLSQTPLVVTSADYGDAYMRSGWASRFLFDLCRCKTIVLVGYSAGDAPVRYFLNVLEADRERFPDLRPAYALDGVKDRNAPDARWGTLAVEPIVYEYSIDEATGATDHQALWRDLGLLADVVERPRATRSVWAEAILGRTFADANTAELDRVSWLFSGRRDLWSLAIKTVDDSAWLDFFADRKLWTEDAAPWIVAAWMARDFASTARFKLSLGWLDRLGDRFANEIARRLGQAKDLDHIRLRAWRLLSISRPHRGATWEGRAYSVQRLLQGPVVLQADLEKAMNLLMPVLELQPNRDELYGDAPPEPPERLADLTRASLTVHDRGGAPELVDALILLPQPNTLMSIATARLQTVVAMLVDIAGIQGELDASEFSVPSVEPHPQNEHHDGPIFVVQVLARLLPACAEADPVGTRRIVETWRELPGTLGVRLWLHALRNPLLFTAEEAIAGLEALSRAHFWGIRREFSVLLRERAADASEDIVARVEGRVIAEGADYYARYEIEEGQPDWRGHARDAEVWLRLAMLNEAGRLSQAGLQELDAIKARRDYLDRPVEDRDFFGSYSSGVHTVVGDAQPILDAQEDDRLDVALEIIRSPDIERQYGWNAYCRSDPSGALDTLLPAPFDAATAPLWQDLIGSLSFPEGERDPARQALVVRIFGALEAATDAFIALISSRLADLYYTSPRSAEPVIGAWWSRLFAICVANDTDPVDFSRELYADAINAPAGRLTQAVLLDIEQQRKAGEPVAANLLAAIAQAAGAEGRQGTLSRAILIQVAGFTLSIEGQGITALLEAALAQDNAEGKGLRAVLANDSRMSATASEAFAAQILRGVAEIEGTGRDATNSAAKILAPALSIIRGQQKQEHWGITVEDCAVALRRGPPALREGAAGVLKRWVVQIEGDAADTWRTGIGPLLIQVWPRERTFRAKELTRHFAELAIGAGDAFPEALTQLLPYLARLEGHGGLHAIERSEAPEKFPRETLTLLWALFGPGCTNDLYGIPKILERLVKALPDIEVDRRLQWLDQQAIRYE